MVSVKLIRQEKTEFLKLCDYIISLNYPDEDVADVPKSEKHRIAGTMANIGTETMRNKYSQPNPIFIKQNFEAYCENFLLDYDKLSKKDNEIDKEALTLFINWVGKICIRKKWKNRFEKLTKDRIDIISIKKENGVQDDSAGLLNRGVKVPVAREEFLSAIKTISDYYSQPSASIYKFEKEQFDIFKRHVQPRLVIDKKYDKEGGLEALNFIKSKQAIHFLKNKWCSYECQEDLIIERALPFNTPYKIPESVESEGFMCLSDYYDKKVRLQSARIAYGAWFDFLHKSISIYRYDGSDPGIFMNFSYLNIFPEICIGHKMYFMRGEGWLKMNVMVMHKMDSSKEDSITSYTEHDFSSKKVPKVVKAILLSPTEVSIEPIPFLNIHNTLNKISHYRGYYALLREDV